MTTTLTLHSMEEPLAKRLRARAKREGKSLNQMAKELLSSALGLSGAPAEEHDNGIMAFCGILKEGKEEMLKALEDFERIDPEDWK